MTQPLSNTQIRMRSIQNLKPDKQDENYCFSVPSYQRGYRWGKTEINTLMDDLSPYFDNDKNLQYCLQPIVVRHRENNVYEVIDGQQRLTTLYILGRYCDVVENGVKYTITYETRQNSEEFLESLSLTNKAYRQKALDNPDFYFMSQAFDCIDSWANEHQKEKPDLYRFWCQVIKNVKVIWYEVPSSTDSIDMFRKINEGKIPLTNAELVKALLLSDSEIIKRHEQTPIAIEWNHMEQQLQNDEFWYFLTGDERDTYSTRMDLIFDIWLSIQNTKPETQNLDNPYAMFTYIYNSSNKNNAGKGILREMWSSCKEIFANLENWYQSNDLYHLFGYLIACRGNQKYTTPKSKIIDLYAEFSGLDKSQLREHIRNKIRNSLKEYGNEPQQIEQLEYNDPKSNTQNLIRNALLLFNLLTINSTTSSKTRFPFDLYKKDKWDIEHIHAIAGGPPTDEEINKNKKENSLTANQIRQQFFKDLKELILSTTSESFNSLQTQNTRNKLISIIQEFLESDDFTEKTVTIFGIGINNKYEIF
ncbi:DUF262 domain-containing protein [Bifidobacterium sp. ESL0769]|uniref:DUF262 domain-containing protein n=1 Tax=Bifidobacterium sp. ESL0769 TaxID=2983229 RepID=UPI0023F77D1D|nr:DUF262 domain-containing protein [Bifidobacterium sp. ESL0769]WEV68055.1 DUF262 domain-containing protein [Bifidobacterium sp. ESL0769]